MKIREAEPEDAGAVIGLLERLYTETAFLLYESGEMVPRVDVENYARRISETRKAKDGIMYLAHDNQEFVGILFGNRGTARRNRHSLFIVMGVLQTHWRSGIGSTLLGAVEYWAKAEGVHRLELTVQKENTRAIALYENIGFETEGTKRHSLAVENRYVDEWFMSKLIYEF